MTISKPKKLIFGEKLTPAFLESAYRTWVEKQGGKPVSSGEFWKFMTAMGFGEVERDGKRYLVVPDKEELRANIANHLGQNERENPHE